MNWLVILSAVLAGWIVVSILTLSFLGLVGALYNKRIGKW